MIQDGIGGCGRSSSSHYSRCWPAAPGPTRHVYNSHALLSGRLWTDIAPAQLQTFLSPTLDIPIGAIRERLNGSPVLLNIVLAMPHALGGLASIRADVASNSKRPARAWVDRMYCGAVRSHRCGWSFGAGNR